MSGCATEECLSDFAGCVSGHIYRGDCFAGVLAHG